jgi:hypothetical protein
MECGASKVTVTVNAAKGSYTGMPTARGYLVTAHMTTKASEVTLNGLSLTEYASLDEVCGTVSRA